MQTTDKLNLKITTPLTFDLDDIKTTITEYGNNFEKLEIATADSIGEITDLISGRLYKYGKRLWDDTPLLGGYIGWVNIREGVHALEWQQLKNYSIDNLIRAFPDNGNVYKCVSDGRSMKNTPTFLTSAGSEFYDANGNLWMEEFNYEVDDVVFSTDGSKLFYFICETSGLSSTLEPNWNTTPVGTTLIDGSVVWRKEKTVKWKQVNASCNFRPFGKIE